MAVDDVRTRPASERDVESRLRAARRRDALARARDVAAAARDRAADARTVALARRRDGEAEEALDARALSASEIVVRAAGRRRRAAEDRAQAAELRDMAARDREAAARDREQAAAERLHALMDRQALVTKFQREHARRGEALGHQYRAEALARTLQRSLSPPRLPRIAGLDVAVHYEPSAPEEVGGDFYDLFPLAGGRSGFFLGDVCGKGPGAAAVTSLARYTMRTAALLHEQPEEILMDLNAALLMEGVGMVNTCTAVYGEIDPGGRAFSVTLAAAGHPPPLIVRASGAVEGTTAHGTILGAFDDPAFVACHVDLDPGDAIVVCSDGMLDTDIDGVRVDEERVARMLSGGSRASARDLVDRLVHALRDVDRPLRDDVAIMALRRTPPAAS